MSYGLLRLLRAIDMLRRAWHFEQLGWLVYADWLRYDAERV